MLLFGFSFPKASTLASPPTHADVASQHLADDTLAPAPCTERHHHDHAVDGLGHYIDSRLCDERFRVD